MPNDLLDPESRHRQRRRRRLFKIGGGIVLVLVIVFFAARPTRHAIKDWQARRHAEKAFSLIEAEQWNDAQREATAAYQLSSTEPAAMRAVARLLSRTRRPEALGFWKALGEKHPLTREDLRDKVSAALVAGELGTADAAVQKLLGNDATGPAPADWLLAAQVAAQKNSPNDAAADAAKVIADPRASERQLFQASLLQLATAAGDSPAAKEIQDAAWARLTRLARGQSEVALDALVVFAQRTLSRPNEIVLDPQIMPNDEVIRALQNHPLSRAPQKLVAFDLQIHADPAARERLIQEAIETWQKADNESLAALARWLNGKGAHQRELDTIPLERALQTRELFLQRLDALGSLGNWAEIKRLLLNETFPLDPVIEHMYLARCNQQLGEVTAAENNWQRALEAAEEDKQKLLTLAEYAEKNGAVQIAETAYDTVVRDAPRMRAVQQGRLRLAQQRRDTRKIHAVLAAMLAQWPNDIAIQNDEAYTRLLLLPGGTVRLRRMSSEADKSPQPDPSAAAKSEIRSSKSETQISSPITATSSPPSRITNNQDLITVEQLAERLVQLEPASLPHRTLLALARLKQGRADAAMEIYQNLTVPPNTATPSAVAVHAAVLAASGREEDARTEAGAVNWEQLLPEEQALIEALRRAP